MEESSEDGCFAWLVNGVGGLELGFSSSGRTGRWQERWEGFPLSEAKQLVQ